MHQPKIRRDIKLTPLKLKYHWDSVSLWAFVLVCGCLIWAWFIYLAVKAVR